MFKNYIKTILRLLTRNKVFSLINIIGLAVGIATCMMLFIWIDYEMSYDRFHEKTDRIYKVVTKYVYPSGEISHFSQTPMVLADALKTGFPEVEDSTIYWRRPWYMKYKNEMYNVDGILTSPAFFNIFSIPLVKGDSSSLLKDPKSVLISEKLASRIFGADDPVGQKITEMNYMAGDFTVSGVFKGFPLNSHMEFDFISPFKLQHGGYGTDFNVWDLSDFETYVLLKNGASNLEFDKKIKNLIKKNLPDSVEELYTVGLTDIHLNKDIWSRKQGSITNIRIFSTVAILILLLACINYVNLAMAKGIERGREIGIRKISGAGRISIALRFLSESIFFTVISAGLALLIIEIISPVFTRLSGTPFTINYGSSTIPIILASVLVFTSLLSGLYPALYLSGQKPVSTLSGIFIFKSGKTTLRKFLLVFQFAISVLLISSLLIIQDQLSYIFKKDLGFNKDQVLICDITPRLAVNWRTFRTELLKSPEIKSMTFSNTIPGKNESTTNDWEWEGKQNSDKSQLSIVGVYNDFIETFGMEVEEGRFFSDKHISELHEGIVVNREAVKVMGLTEPIGKSMKIGNAKREGKIIGVVKDYHFSSLKEKIGPMVFLYGFGLDELMIKINSADLPRTMKYIESTFRKIAPGDPFKYSFLDDEINSIYTDENRLSELLKSFTLLAIFISCIGLYGISMHTVFKRMKEIGIRKVNGAKQGDILSLVLRDSLKWVLVANLLAWPLAYYFMSAWLKGFAYRINISIIPFLYAGLIALLLALFTVLYHSLKVSRLNPVDTLRYE